MDLTVGALYFVSILEAPAALALWLIIVEAALEASLVRVDPLALDHLALHENANVLLSGLLKDVSSFSVLFALFPVSRVDIFVLIGHDTFTVAFVLFPVAVVGTDLTTVLITVLLFANAALHTAAPFALVGDGGFLVVTSGVVFVNTFAITQLKSKTMLITSTVTS